MGVKNRLKSIRHQMEIDSQKEMAKLLGLTQSQVSLFESQEKQPSLETVLKIARKLNLPVEQIVYLEESPE